MEQQGAKEGKALYTDEQVHRVVVVTMDGQEGGAMCLVCVVVWMWKLVFWHETSVRFSRRSERSVWHDTSVRFIWRSERCVWHVTSTRSIGSLGVEVVSGDDSGRCSGRYGRSARRARIC